MRKQTILYITELFPYPPDSGAKIKSINTIQTLSKKFNIVLIAFSDQKVSPKQRDKLAKLTIFQKVFLLPNLNQEPKHNLIRLFSNYLKLKPYFLYQFHSKSAEKFISTITNKFNFSAIHIDHLNMAQYLPKQKRCAWIYEEHNIENVLAKSKYLNFSRISKTKLFLLIEYLLTLRYEKNTIKKFDSIFAISVHDHKEVQKLCPQAQVITQNLIFPLGKKNSSTHLDSNVLFVGDISWYPNTEALTWFIKNVWPSIIKRRPATKLNIVGKVESNKVIKELKSENIIFHGYQRSIQKYLNKSNLFILPFSSGSGVRVKALTAIANQIPIVSTPVGILGLDLKANEDYLLAETALKFANQCIKVLDNKELAQKISQSALIYLKRNHSKEKSLDFLNQYESIIQVPLKFEY